MIARLLITRLRLPLLTAALALAALALVACGGDDPPGATPPPDQAPPAGGDDGASTVIQVELNEWGVIPDSGSAPAGTVTFEASNTGALPHDLVVVHTELPHGELPMSGGAVNLDADELEVVAHVPEVRSGASAGETATLDPGAYVLFCSVPGHYSAGMHTAFTVE